MGERPVEHPYRESNALAVDASIERSIPILFHRITAIKREYKRHDRLASHLSPADDGIRIFHWLPPGYGIVPQSGLVKSC
jgi:hypothetical protein